MSFDIFEIVSERPTIKVIDVGAMSVGAGTDSYASLVQAGLAQVVGFEPVQAECDKLNAAANGAKVFLPYALGDGTTRTLHVCNAPMTSSLYEPYTDLANKFQNLGNLMQVVQEQEVDTRRLDDIGEAEDPDYLKLDVQGAEVDVLMGARRSLSEAVVVHTEVVFVPLYKNQALFAEIDQHLRREGYSFHKFCGICGRTFKPLVVNGNLNQAMSQQLWTDAVYVKDFMHLDRLQPEKLLKLAIIMHLIYGSFDLAAFVLRAYDAKTGANLAELYVRRLTAPRPAP